MTSEHVAALKTALAASAYHLAAGNLEQAQIANGWGQGIVVASESGTPPPPPPPALKVGP